jgi:hypothetical protein
MRTSLSIKAQRCGDLWVLIATGIVSAHTVGIARATITRLFRQEDARAAVVDIRRAVLVLDRDDWVNVAEPANSADVPLVFVVADRDKRALRQHCTRMHASGFFRLAVTDYGQALDWAAACLAHWRHSPLAFVAECVETGPPRPLHLLQQQRPATPSPEALGH